MDANKELLYYMYKNTEMLVYTYSHLLDDLEKRENKIKPEVEFNLEKAECFLKEVEKHLDGEKVKPDLIAHISSDFGMKMKVMTDNSDAAIAGMIIEGLTMGLTEIESKIKKFDKSVKKEIINLVNDYKKFLEKQKEKIEKYL